MSFEEKQNSTLPFMPQEANDYCTTYYTLGQGIKDFIFYFFSDKRDLANCKVEDKHRL
jgi:hypothetical protein